MNAPNPSVGSNEQTLKLNILTPERQLVEALPIEEILLTGSEGQIQILPGHIAMIGTLCTGLFQYQPCEGKSVFGVISSGFFEVCDESVQIIAETLELENEINLERAHSAQIRAEENLQTPSSDDLEFKKQQLKLQRAMIRQQIGSSRGVFKK